MKYLLCALAICLLAGGDLAAQTTFPQQVVPQEKDQTKKLISSKIREFNAHLSRNNEAAARETLSFIVETLRKDAATINLKADQDIDSEKIAKRDELLKDISKLAGNLTKNGREISGKLGVLEETL